MPSGRTSSWPPRRSSPRSSRRSWARPLPARHREQARRAERGFRRDADSADHADRLQDRSSGRPPRSLNLPFQRHRLLVAHDAEREFVAGLEPLSAPPQIRRFVIDPPLSDVITSPALTPALRGVRVVGHRRDEHAVLRAEVLRELRRESLDADAQPVRAIPNTVEPRRTRGFAGAGIGAIFDASASRTDRTLKPPARSVRVAVRSTAHAARRASRRDATVRPGSVSCTSRLELPGAAYALAVELDDDVSLLESGFLRRDCRSRPIRPSLRSSPSASSDRPRRRPATTRPMRRALENAALPVGKSVAEPSKSCARDGHARL